MSEPFKIKKELGLYPIVYVRGFAATSGEREETFYDTYYGYSATAVERRQGRPKEGEYLTPIVFEGQLIRFLKEYGYVDAANGGLPLALSNAGGLNQNPMRSVWISRFYDPDVMSERVRRIEDHANDLARLICEEIPAELKKLRELDEKGVDVGPAVDLGPNGEDYKVILVAHSMGGLVCRCLIQNVLREVYKQDPKRWIHRLVTIGTPHGGIELSAVPDFLEELVAGKGNVINSAIFKEGRMRDYLRLNGVGSDGAQPDLKSLNGAFPVGRCLCVVGSDHKSYNVVKKATGSHSDGLVKQSRAYIRGAYWANVHRAHSGRRGLVNSFETYENVRRFLFGDTRVELWLENVGLNMAEPDPEKKIDEFYDVEFSLAVRGTGVFLHQRKQNPCENAQRFERVQFPLPRVHLHTGFLDTKLRPRDARYSHFLLAFRVAQHRVRDGFLFDTQYPERTIYSETMEARVDLQPGDTPDRVQYRWLSETTDDKKGWTRWKPDLDGVFRSDFRKARTLTGKLCVRPSPWSDEVADQDHPHHPQHKDDLHVPDPEPLEWVPDKRVSFSFA